MKPVKSAIKDLEAATLIFRIENVPDSQENLKTKNLNNCSQKIPHKHNMSQDKLGLIQKQSLWFHPIFKTFEEV